MTSISTPKTTHGAVQIGQVVSWAGPDGETISGTVQQYNPEIGKLIVKTDDGIKAVPLGRLDPPEPDAAGAR
jgi:hypothetical protein